MLFLSNELKIYIEDILEGVNLPGYATESIRYLPLYIIIIIIIAVPPGVAQATFLLAQIGYYFYEKLKKFNVNSIQIYVNMFRTISNRKKN